MKKIIFLTALFLCLGVYRGNAQVQVIHNFNGNPDLTPHGNLTIINNVLYGTTVNGNGIFSVNIDGSNYKDLYLFHNNMANPSGSLTPVNGKLYGMTPMNNGGGNIFSIDTDGTDYKDLFDFNASNGAGPFGNVTYASNVLYGMTSNGGIYGRGVIFSIDTNGTNFKDILSFNDTNGANPGGGSLVLSGNTLYGTTQYGGANNLGVIFSIHTNGTNYQDLFDFDSASGDTPYRSVMMAGGKFYGMTYEGEPIIKELFIQ